uniref:Uncharacterized protein n=1 Tax=Triticum urartu TaxID=4572 RepID=A0A8R7QGU7_TRIUA
ETSSRTTPSSPRPLCSFSQSRWLGVSIPTAPPTTTSTSTSGPPRSFSISSASAHSETASHSLLICLPRRCARSRPFKVERNRRCYQLPIPIEARPIPIEVHPPNPTTGGEEQPVRSRPRGDLADASRAWDPASREPTRRARGNRRVQGNQPRRGAPTGRCAAVCHLATGHAPPRRLLGERGCCRAPALACRTESPAPSASCCSRRRERVRSGPCQPSLADAVPEGFAGWVAGGGQAKLAPLF